MLKTIHIKNFIYPFLLLFSGIYGYAQASISAMGDQAFCAGSPINIVTEFSISDPSNTTIEAFYIQISVGYQRGFDNLDLGTRTNHPTILPDWNPETGKLTLLASLSGKEMLFSDLENAVKDIVFTTTATDIVPEKKFSLSIGDANYLPETDHFYQFISDVGITWTAAKIAAESLPLYYGRRGYLATLTSEIEADFAGKQSSGAGWIGASDAENEGEWKWVTGPETDTVFWIGQENGTGVGYSKWNNGEPNDTNNNEDYAHITDPSVGIPGAWNDLPNMGDPPGTLYHPQGYIVEYGGMSGDMPTNIQAITSIFIPQIESSTEATICESGIATISAIASDGDILWFDEAVNGTRVGTGNHFTSPFLTETTIYYATASINSCTTLPRTPVTITVKPRPAITSTTDDLICSGFATLSATASDGQVFWYDSLTSTDEIFIGNTFETPDLTSTKIYYVTANIDGCETATRTPVKANVDGTIPQFDLLQNDYVLCDDIGSVVLETTNPQGSYSYSWRNETTLFEEKTPIISVTSQGNYFVSAISEAGCFSEEKFISVRNSEIATITKDDVIIVDDATNNSIQVANQNLGIGDYEFAIDDEFGTYNDVGFFQNLSTGIHTLFIRDQLGCGTTSFRFSILAYPKFFTPNGDGENDFWTISGFDANFYTLSKISIFDRFGKLIYIIKENSAGWNGDFQGKKMPSNSYWFRTILTDINGYSVEKSGSFSLLRD